MRLSKQTADVVAKAGDTLGRLYTMGLTPLQILLLMEVRWQEATAPTPSAHVFTSNVIREVGAKFAYHGCEAPSRQGCWDALKSLQDRKLLYIAPPGKKTSKRSVMLTAHGDTLFTYPRNIQLY